TGPRSGKKPERGGEENGRRIDAGHGTSEVERAGQVLEGVEGHHYAERIGSEYYPAGPAERQGIEAKEQQDGEDQTSEPNTKGKSREGQPGEALTDSEDGGVVDRQEVMCGLIGDVETKGESQSQPGAAEASVGHGTRRYCIKVGGSPLLRPGRAEGSP